MQAKASDAGAGCVLKHSTMTESQSYVQAGKERAETSGKHRLNALCLHKLYVDYYKVRGLNLLDVTACVCLVEKSLHSRYALDDHMGKDTWGQHGVACSWHGLIYHTAATQ